MKKIKFIICVIVSISIVILSLSDINSQSNNSNNLKNRFYLGPFNFYFLNTLRDTTHNQWYRDLNYNAMQSYCGHFDNADPDFQTIGQKDGGFFEDTSNYADSMRSVIGQWRQLSGDNSLIFQREKILRPAYGQQSIYQSEYPGTWSNKFPGYGYCDTTVTGENYTEGSISGRKCIKDSHKAGFIVKDLYENREQTNDTRIIGNDINSSGWERLYSDIKQPKYNNRWYIKPRMRINPDSGLVHLDDTVVVVYTKNFAGRYLDTFAVRCRNFFDANHVYDGSYIEMFHQLGPDSSTFLSVRADSLAAGKTSLSDTNSLVDYMVKWSGNVDVWLDYVKVEDSWSHYLFTDTYENELIQSNPNPWKFHRRIKEEVEAFNNISGLGYFWIDEMQYNNLACVGEVNKLVKQYSGGTLSILFITDPVSFQGWSGFKHQNPVEQSYWDACIDSAIRWGALDNIMVTQWFPMYYTKRYPDILLTPRTDSFPATQYFNKAQNYSDYTYENNCGVQPAISWYVRQHKYYIQKAKTKGLIYAVINQLNSDENNINPGLYGDWGIREPTNEEISLIMNTSLAYGSKILFEFSYTSDLQDAVNKTYNWGLTSTKQDSYANKKLTNYYGQPKWDYVAA